MIKGRPSTKARLAALACLVATVTVHAGTGDSCSLPGEDVADGNSGTDVGFSAGPSNGAVGAPANYPSENIQSLYWAEPAGFDGAVAITMKVDTLAPAEPASATSAPDQLYEEFWLYGF